MAAGKSTIAKAVAEKYNAKHINEEFKENPYLEKYYSDMKKYVYDMQMWYLQKRIEQLVQYKDYSIVVQDQMIDAFGYVFPMMQEAAGYLTCHDLARLEHLTDKYTFDFNDEIFSNEIIIYLRFYKDDIKEILKRINSRGRNYEREIKEDYLSSLIDKYELWYKENNASKNILVSDALCPVDFILQNITDALINKEKKDGDNAYG